MRITVDTNVLVRALVGDDPAQTEAAAAVLLQAEQVCVAMPSLCELVWVLKRVYDFPITDVVAAIRALLDADTVALDRAAAEAGLALLEAGGDFADGVIAHEGRWLGGETFVSFDRKAVDLLQQQGIAAQVLH